MTENEQNNGIWLAEQFEENRGHLRAVAYRMLGSASEADDAVQEAWLRLSRAGAEGIDNLGGWLTTVVARVCLDMLRSRKARREESLDVNPAAADTTANAAARSTADPEREALLADSVGLAMLLVLNTLAPQERVAFVLHDMFGVSFDEIAPIVGRNAAAARQLASRARRRIQGSPTLPEADLARQREVIDAFLAAARGGDFEALLTLLDPEVVFRTDEAALRISRANGFDSVAERRGANAVATAFSGRAQAARSALLDGIPGIVVIVRGELLVAMRVTIADGRITALDAIADRDALDHLDLAVLGE
jgi:RNA polymerase sigma-70 factor, ECF subfamily